MSEGFLSKKRVPWGRIAIAISGILAALLLSTRLRRGDEGSPASTNTLPIAAGVSELPDLDGTWTMRAIDMRQIDWTYTTLKFTTQARESAGLKLAGSFIWRRNQKVVGTEYFEGSYDPTTRRIAFEPTSVLVFGSEGGGVASYEAVLSADGRRMHGRWYGDEVVASDWEAVPLETLSKRMR